MGDVEWFIAGFIMGCLVCGFAFCAAMASHINGGK